MESLLSQINNTSAAKNLPLSELEALPEPFKTILAVLYSGTAIVALVANILAIFILITKKRSSADLRKYLVNLAIADISMAGFSLPFTYSDFMYGNWRFPNILCPLTHFITICSVCVSIFTLTAIGIERYIAIVYPMKYCWWCESHTAYIILLIWTMALIISSPLLYYARTTKFKYGDATLYDCREIWEGQTISMIYTSVLFVITFIMPFIALTFLYGSIGIKTFRHIQPGEAHTNRDRAQQRIKIKVIKMLLTLVTVFLICWAPLQIFNLIIWCFQDLRYNIEKHSLHYYLYFGLYFSFHLLSQFHTFLNPFIYCYMSNNFSVSDLRSLLDRRLPKSCYDKPAHRRSAYDMDRNSIEIRPRITTLSTTKTHFSNTNSVL